ncbi:MAG: MBL fold metallo-hydrolase, partial [Actinomycetes bacterium]
MLGNSAPTEPGAVPGLTRIAFPVGLHGIESVNVYALADGGHVTLVDCGVWRAELGDNGLAALTRGLDQAGYELRDISRIIITHAHIDHYGLAGRLMEVSGAE